jgi:hypothetical protein
VITTVKWISSFLVSRFFLDILSSFGDEGGYWFFSFLCLCGGAYVFFFVPETKGKTLEEIQQVYLNNMNKNKT